MTSWFSQVFCVLLPVPARWGNNKVRYRLQGGVVGSMPGTNQSSAQNVAAGVFPPCSQVQFPLFINMIYIFTCKKHKSKLKISQLLRVWLIRGLLQHSSFLGRSVAVELRGRCLGGLHPATHTRNAS